MAQTVKGLSGTRYGPLLWRRYGFECYWTLGEFARLGRMRDA